MWIRLIKAYSSLFTTLLKSTLANVSRKSPLKASLNLLALNLVTGPIETFNGSLVFFGSHHFSIISLSICVLRHISLKRCVLCEISMYSLLDSFMLNCFSILSMYMNCDNSSILLGLSLWIFFPNTSDVYPIYFTEKFLDNQIFTN